MKTRFALRPFMAVALLMASVAHSSFAADPDPFASNKAYNDGVRAQGDLLKAKAEYIKALIEAKLSDSKIRLANAQALYQETLVQGLLVQIDAMQYELARVKREDWKTERKIHEIEKYAACTSNISVGNANAEVIYQCLMPFLQTYISASILRDVMKIQVSALPITQFRANDESSYIEAFPGGNMGQLMDFVGTRDLSVVRWSPAHFYFLDMISTLGAYAEMQIQKYQAYMIGIRSGTLNIWTLPKS